MLLRRSHCDSFRKKRRGGGSDQVDAPLPAAKKSKEEKREESQLKVCSVQLGGVGQYSDLTLEVKGRLVQLTASSFSETSFKIRSTSGSVEAWLV